MNSPHVILVVNRSARNTALLTDFLDGLGYHTVGAGNLGEFDRLLEEDSHYSLALIDVSGFDQQIWSRCGRLRTAAVPFLLISSSRRPMGVEQGRRQGATGVLTKPLPMKELAHIIGTLIS